MKTVEVNSSYSNRERLQRDVELDSRLGPLFVGLTINNVKVFFYFDDAFDSADESYLVNEFLPAFIDMNNDMMYVTKIHSMLTCGIAEIDLHDVNYKLNVKPNLYPKRTQIKGEIIKVEWFSDVELTNKILDVDITYVRDYFGFAVSRETVRTWYLNNEMPSDYTKTTTKRYDINVQDQITEGKRRRKNIVDAIQLPVMSMMVSTMMVEPWSMTQTEILLRGREFLDMQENEFQKFVENSSSVTDVNDPNFGKKNIIISFENASTTSHAWLLNTPAALGGTLTILDYLSGEFTI